MGPNKIKRNKEDKKIKHKERAMEQRHVLSFGAWKDDVDASFGAWRDDVDAWRVFLSNFIIIDIYIIYM